MLNEDEEMLRLVSNIAWKSVDKDNMEFSTTVSVYQKEALTRLILLCQAKVYGMNQTIV